MYLSRSLHPMGHSSDADILATAGSRNAEMGVTGILFRSEHSFLEVLEGEEDSVDALMELIRADDRHQITSEWPKRQSTERLFSDWTMETGTLPREKLEAIQDPKIGDDVVWSAMMATLKDLSGAGGPHRT